MHATFKFEHIFTWVLNSRISRNTRKYKTLKQEQKMNMQRSNKKFERKKSILFVVTGEVGRKFRTFQHCPHLLCKKASLHNPKTCLYFFLKQAIFVLLGLFFSVRFTCFCFCFCFAYMAPELLRMCFWVLISLKVCSTFSRTRQQSNNRFLILYDAFVFLFGIC